MSSVNPTLHSFLFFATVPIVMHPCLAVGRSHPNNAPFVAHFAGQRNVKQPHHARSVGGGLQVSLETGIIRSSKFRAISECHANGTTASSRSISLMSQHHHQTPLAFFSRPNSLHSALHFRNYWSENATAWAEWDWCYTGGV